MCWDLGDRERNEKDRDSEREGTDLLLRLLLRLHAVLAVAAPVLQRVRHDSTDAETDKTHSRGVEEKAWRIGDHLVVVLHQSARVGLPRDNIQGAAFDARMPHRESAGLTHCEGCVVVGRARISDQRLPATRRTTCMHHSNAGLSWVGGSHLRSARGNMGACQYLGRTMQLGDR